MEPEARVRLIQGVRDKIQPMPWGDEDLLLDEFGIGRRPVQEIYGDRWPLTDWLRQASEADLVMPLQAPPPRKKSWTSLRKSLRQCSFSLHISRANASTSAV